MRDYTRPDWKERNDAREAGHVRYEGMPCPKNPEHGLTRYVSNGACVACGREMVKVMSDPRRVFSYRLHIADHAALRAYARRLETKRNNEK